MKYWSKRIGGHAFISCVFALFFIVFVHSSAHATSYYVDPDITDTNPASATPDFLTYNPITFETTGGTDSVYKTVADVNLKTFLAGDFIYFKRGGTWNEQLTIAQSGSDQHPITIDAFGSGNKPIFNAGGVRNYAIYSVNTSYITIQNVKVQNAVKWDLFLDGTGTNIIVDTVDTVGGAIGVYTRYKSNTRYSNITVTGATNASYAFLVTGTGTTTDVTADHITSTGNAGTGIWFITITNLTASYLTAQNNGLGGILIGRNGTITGVLNASHLVAGGGPGLGNTGDGIEIKGSTNLTYSLTDSTSSYNTGGGLILQNLRNGTISGTVDNFLAEYNGSNSIEVGQVTDTIIKNSIGRYSTGANGIAVIVESSNLTFDNNTTNNNYWDGVSFKGTGSNYTIKNCTSFSNGTVGQAASGDGYTSHDTVENLNIYNSVAHDNLNSGFAMTGSSTGTIYHSTFYNNGSGSFTRGGFWVAQMTGGSGWTIKNNIFYNNFPYEVVLDAASIPYQTADHNVFYHPSDNKFATLNYGVSDITWTTYHVTNGYESNSVYGDPLFLNVGSLDIHLLSGSPAINLGADVSVLTDKDDNTRPQGLTPDAGAYEFLIPSVPSALSQYKADGSTAIGPAVYTGESTVVLKFNLSSSNNPDSLIPQVEIRENGIAFSNAVTHSGDAVVYSGSPVTGTVTVTGLTSAAYHWQARISNTAGQSAWVAMGGNPDFSVDLIAPSAVGTPTFGTITSSSIVINKPAVVTETGSGLYQWQARKNSVTELGLNAVGTTSITNSSLSENTQYTYDVQFNDIVLNTSSYGTSATKYTLADTPTGLSYTSNKDSVTLTVDSFPNDTSGSSGYYFSRTGANSDWIAVNTWQNTGLSCGNAYTYSVIYRNGDGVETDPLTVIAGTKGCGSSSFSTPAPKPDLSNLIVSQDNGETTTPLSTQEQTAVTWTSTGTIPYVSLYYSLDGGLSWVNLAGPMANQGMLVFTMPGDWGNDVMIKVEGTDLAIILDTLTSESIALVEPVTPSANDTGANSLSPPILSYTELTAPSPVTGLEELVSSVEIGDYIRSPYFSTVYYVTEDFERRPFMDAQTYFTYENSFDKVKVVSDATLPLLNLAGPMLPKPGVKLVKIQSDPKVYLVEENPDDAYRPILRWISSEELAINLYGEDWAKKVIDIPVTLFARFEIGDPIFLGTNLVTIATQ
jgi:hypothetical protein